MADALFATPNRVERLQIEITTGCNLACAGCQRTIGIAAGQWTNAVMKRAAFEKVIANAPPARVLVLQGIGEPTLHTDLEALIRVARATGKFEVISFNTNALLRSLDDYLALARAGLGHVSVSVDSFDPVTAELLRSGTDVVRLEAMVAGLVRLFPGMTLSIVLSRRNLGELEGLIAHVHRLGVRFVEVQPLISYADGSMPHCLDARDVAEARAILARAGRAHPGLVLMPAAALTPNGNRCRRPFRALYVTVDGFLTPCCTTNDVDLFGRTDLLNRSFAEAWAAEGPRRWLDAFFDRDDAICHGCAFNPAGPEIVRPDLATARAHQDGGRLPEAEAALRAVAADPTVVESLHRLGLILADKGDDHAGAALLEASVTLSDEPRWAHNTALILGRQGRLDESIARLRALLAARPDYVPTYRSLAARLDEAGDAVGAADVLSILVERALDSDAADALASGLEALLAGAALPRNLIFLANRLRMAGRQDDARRLLDRRLAVAPDDLEARFTRAIAALAVVHRDEAEIDTRRAAYARDLADVAERVAQASAAERAAAIGVVGAAKPFFLSYQGRDDRALQETYGTIVAALSQSRRVALPAPAPAPRLRIGFVTYYFTLHSVSKLFAGWMEHLDRAGFEVFGYNLSGGSDATSRRIAATCDRWHQEARSTEAWIDTIRADAPHVLIHLELGMSDVAIRLATHRLAPVQCQTWGHPVTSGLLDIDYFLSSDLMEPADGAAHYRETLVRLPNLSIAYAPLDTVGGRLRRSDVGLRSGATVYMCCQSLFKYRPSDDVALVRIAAAVPDSQFLFIAGDRRPPTVIFRERLASAFRAAGLDPDHHLVFAAPVPFENFHSLMEIADVYLDSIGWSGGNTTLEALAAHLPVVTLPTGLMRGRHSFAILTRMGLDEGIAADLDGYVAAAVGLADPGTRAAARARVAERLPRLYGDLEPVRALEAFFVEAVARAAAATTTADAPAPVGRSVDAA
ncbi:O-linked N-acetylglucosamine transferase family protein [Siculibacillus lacustris]|uniref:O-linked N-acetylglucosamine transferase family protein n=1 Tax=Siculibacillus lacustris TaxID=1549641 RepID=UPI0013F14C84|nr:radical SAM protein [Siculibacillus lacustris]